MVVPAVVPVVEPVVVVPAVVAPVDPLAFMVSVMSSSGPVLCVSPLVDSGGMSPLLPSAQELNPMDAPIRRAAATVICCLFIAFKRDSLQMVLLYDIRNLAVKI